MNDTYFFPKEALSRHQDMMRSWSNHSMELHLGECMKKLSKHKSGDKLQLEIILGNEHIIQSVILHSIEQEYSGATGEYEITDVYDLGIVKIYWGVCLEIVFKGYRLTLIGGLFKCQIDHPMHQFWMNL